MDETIEMTPALARFTPLVRISLALAVCLAGCAGLATTPEARPSTPVPSSVPFLPTSTSAPADSQTLTLWVPEGFAPDDDTAGASRFAARLAAFQELHPGLTLDVRVKARSGTAGIAESLLAADAAAPSALPDLALLDPNGLEAAALRGLLVPLDGVLTPPSVSGWTDAAGEAARVNGVFFGMPLASDAVGLAYRKDVYAAAPARWIDLLRGPAPFVFPVADPSALFLLSQYQSLGGALIDASRRPSLDPALLTLLLGWENSMHSAGRLPLSTGQMATNSEGWSALLGGRAVSATASFHDFSSHDTSSNLALVPLPGREGPGQAYASTWCWGLLAKGTGGQTLAAELLLWLSDDEFTGPYARDLALLPPTRSGVDLWPQDSIRDAAAGLIGALREVPSTELQAALGPRVRDAALAVLTGKLDAASAAQAAAAPAPPVP